MSSEIKLFWLEATDQAERYLRKWESASPEVPRCPAHGFHQAYRALERGPAVFALGDPHKSLAVLPCLPANDPRWPSKCDHCDYEFRDPHRSHAQHLLYRRSDGEMLTRQDSPVGSMWDAHWYRAPGPDGICLVVKTPAGEWLVDGKASNCQARDLDHYCWPRTGDPRDPQGPSPLNVAGNGGCKVGAGSISIRSRLYGNYHGFLRNGYLRAC